MKNQTGHVCANTAKVGANMQPCSAGTSMAELNCRIARTDGMRCPSRIKVEDANDDKQPSAKGK